MLDEGNVALVTSAAEVDRINTAFYTEFPYPWPANVAEKLADPLLATHMQAQAVGSWDRPVLPRNPKLWVAGCGVNQGALTALRFPSATVRGSDLSPRSLEHEANTAKHVGVQNLSLKRESITEVDYRQEFDYVICTGVIMVTADPRASLASLARALKPDGIMQVMVYCRYHRLAVTSFVKAVRILEQFAEKPDFKQELRIAKQLLADPALANAPARTKDMDHDSGDSELADAVIQPVEYGYTVESFEAMADSCGLELLAPFIDPFSMSFNSFLWNLQFTDPELRERYEALPDTRRWQITNLLLMGKSPLLWFYLQHKSSSRRRPTEHETCEAFLDRTFTRCRTERQVYVRRPRGHYELQPSRHPYPGIHPDAECRQIVDEVERNPYLTMRQILQRRGAGLTFYNVNRLRMLLTTEAFPFLRAATMSRAA